MNSKNQILSSSTFHNITYGNKEIHFSLIKSDRKTLRIEVLPNMEVVVRAPLTISNSLIFDRIRKRALWIFNQIGFFQSFQPRSTPKKYISGETFLYLGRTYILKTELTEENEYVKLKGRYIIVYVNNLENTKFILDKWYLENAKSKFPIYINGVLDKLNKYDIVPYKINIRPLKNKWGSCSSKGNITLNSELIKTPRGCIEYVLIHECCHLIEFGHTRRFYELLTIYMSDWKKWKNKLEKLMA